MKNLMHKSLLWALAIPAILASCAKEIENPDNTPKESVEVSQGHPVTITAGLPAETRISHDLNGTSIHPLWETGDQVKVSFTLNEETVVEVFTLESGANSQSATFSNSNSLLEDNMPFTIDYVDTRHPEGWAVQDGKLANLPECLSGSAQKLSDAVSLTPALTYFHVVATIPSGSTFSSAYLNKLEGVFKMYSAPGVKGAITVTPTGGFSGTVDFYIAVKLDGQTSANGLDTFGATVSPKFQIAFANGTQGLAVHEQGVLVSGDNYKYNWSPTKDYAAGKVYKIADKTFTATTAAQAMPR